MLATPLTITVPLRQDEDGNIRVSDTWVTLDTLIAHYNQGETPETIHSEFPTVSLMDIYVVAAYYLAHRDEVDSYMQHRHAEATRIRQEEVVDIPPRIIRSGLLAHLVDEERPQDDE